MTPKEVLALCREKDVKAVDLRFMDFPGLWQHFTIPVDKLDEDVFEDGLGFDGSSIRGWQAINESDMLVVPQPETAVLDPFCTIPTLSMICNIQDPITREDYTRDPRNVARKSVNYLKSTGIGDTCFIGPGGRVLHLRRRPLRPDGQQRLLLPRQHRRPVEPRPRREARTWATSCATRKATSPFRRPTR